jgi:Flp pilus assembly protein TadG
MAAIAPVFLLFVFTIFEFGRLYLVRHMMDNAARDAARAGSLRQSSNAAVLDRVRAGLQGSGVSGSVTSTILVNGVSSDVSTAVTGDVITVTLTTNKQQFSVLPIHVFTGQLEASAVRRKE